MLRTFAQILGFTLILVVPTSASALDKQTQASSKVQLIQAAPSCNGGHCLDFISFTKQVNCGSIEGRREQKDCFTKTYQQADQRLKQVYSRLVAFFELDAAMLAERKRRLSRAQEAWVKFRDSNCEFRSSGREQEKRAVFQESCRARMTQERAQELEEFLQRGS